MRTTVTLIICTLMLSQASFGQNINKNAGILNGDSCNSLSENDTINIYLLMGLTREAQHWSPLFLSELKKNIPNARIFFLELPGCGKYVKQKAAFSMKGMIDFMRPEVLEIMKKNEGKNIICATSLGGMLACEWTISYKNDFQGLIMVNSSFKNICTQKERAQKGVRKTMFKIPFAKTIEKREKLIISINSNRLEIYDSLTKTNIAIQQKRKVTRRNIFRQTIAGMRYSPKGKKPQVPLLIFGSKADRVVCTDCIQKTYDAFGGTLVWNTTSGHGLPIDEPVWLGAQIANWVNNQFKQATLANK